MRCCVLVITDGRQLAAKARSDDASSGVTEGFSQKPSAFSTACSGVSVASYGLVRVVAHYHGAPARSG